MKKKAHKRLKKKAFEMQLHWIFILFAGAMILSVIFTVVVKQRSLANENLAISLGKALNTFLVKSSEAGGTKLPIDEFSDFKLGFSCSDFCDCRFDVSGVSQPLNDKIVFAPKLIDKAEFTLWTLPWNVPFRVDNFVFLIPDSTKFYVVSSDSSNPLVSKIVSEIGAQRITSVSDAAVTD